MDLKKNVVFVVVMCFLCGISMRSGFAEEVREDWSTSEGSYDTNLYYHWNNIGSVLVKTDSHNDVYVTGTSSDYYRAYKTIKYDKQGNKLWERKTKGAYNQHCYPEDLKLDNAGNIYITGGCYSDAKYYDVYTVKYDSNGTLLWSAAYDGGENRFDLGRALALDQDGNVYVGGSSYKTDQRSDYVVIKYDQTGNQSWVARYHAGSFREQPWYTWPVPSSDHLNALAVDGAGNVYAAGVIKISPANYPSTEYALVKFDSSGNQLWVRTYPAPGHADGEAQLVVDAAGNAYLLGGSGIVLKFDPLGNQLWDMRVPAAYYPTGNLALGKSGNLYVAISETLCGGMRPYDCADYKTLKIDPNGTVLWSATYDNAGASDVASTFALDDDENVYVTGYRNWVYSTIKYDTNGTRLWEIQSPAGHYPTSISVDNERNVYVTGGTYAGNIYTFRMTTVKYVQPEYNTAPFADAGPDQTIECSGPEGAAAILDGSGSSDPNSDALTYSWSWTGGSASGVNPAVTLPLGTTIVTLTVDDAKGGTATDTAMITVRDTTPPATMVRSIAGITGDNGWYRSELLVTADAVDACTGVREIRGTADGVETATAGGTVSVTVRGDGVHNLSFAATDNAGNTSLPAGLAVGIDTTAPAISAAISPLANAAGWHNSDAVITFTCSDSGSGVTACTSPITVSAEAAGQVITGTVVDKAGNSASASIALNMDKTGPVITITGVQNGATYELGLLPSAQYGATDALSGLAASSAALAGGDGLGLGTFTYTATATDKAGNGSSAAATYQVIAAPNGMIALLNSLVASGQVDPTIANSLLAKLNAILQAPNGQAADSKLQAFINEVSAQAGKKITADTAAVLINAATYIMNNN